MHYVDPQNSVCPAFGKLHAGSGQPSSLAFGYGHVWYVTFVFLARDKSVIRAGSLRVSSKQCFTGWSCQCLRGG